MSTESKKEQKVVAIRPISDSWTQFVNRILKRQVTPNKNSWESDRTEEVNQIIKDMMRSGKNIGVTGEMGIGMTTMFRACMKDTERK